ncbi:MAG: molybdenum ABC transporter permease [Deltaproteobacteria bacterium]|nr:MAG: molybdenum ABC transporter permease [Deltaproteobacteria bacterium]
MRIKRDIFVLVNILSGAVVLTFILLPLIQMIATPSLAGLKAAVKDKDVIKAIWLSVYASSLAAIISFVIGTPFAYLLARKNFWGKRFIESIVDLPIVVPHPVVGIAILGVVGRNHWIGQLLHELGLRIMGSVPGIVTVLTFVGMPFYINTVKSGFESISPRLENVSRSLGASLFSTFFRVTFPLAWRSMIVGMIMCCARAISEFGAVVIVAYHPMVAPVLIYERFEAYGLAYSQPVAVLLVLVCLILFLFLRIMTMSQNEET